MTNDQLLSKINSSSFTFDKLTEIAEVLDAMKTIVINGRPEDIEAIRTLQDDTAARDLRIAELETQLAATVQAQGDAPDAPPTNPLAAEQPLG